jgi:uncharacterized membrane protein (DUF2068 family)
MTDEPKSQKHPPGFWRVTLFGLAVLLLGSGLNLLRAVWAWGQARALADLSPSMPMPLLAGASLVWSVVFALCAVGLWRRRPWGRVGTLVAVTAYHGYVWVNHIAFDRSDYARQVWPFAIVHTLLTLLIVWGFLNLPMLRRIYEGEKHENKKTPSSE